MGSNSKLQTVDAFRQSETEFMIRSTSEEEEIASCRRVLSLSHAARERIACSHMRILAFSGA